MLKIFKLKTAKDMQIQPSQIKHKGDYVGKDKILIPASKEWSNSVYTFDKNFLKLLPVADNVIIKLIRSYFNMYSRKLEKKINARRLRTWKRRRTAWKVWVSKPELKHTTDKIIITLYVYNREYIYYLKKLFLTQVHFPKEKIYTILKHNKLLLAKLKKSSNKLYYKLLVFIKEYIDNAKLPIKLKQIIFFNTLKFGINYILPLKLLIQKIYNKKVQFNLVVLKNYHLNSDILAQIITLKIRNKKNKLLRVLSNSLRKVRTPILNKKTIIRVPLKLVGVQNNLISDFILKASVKSLSNDLLDKALKSIKKKNLENILDTTKYKTISGVKIQASGRLTKRITAARAMYKFKYVGTLKNVDSSFKGLSSVTSKGNQKLNLQYTCLNSKTKIGAFGVKGWVASY